MFDIRVKVPFGWFIVGFRARFWGHLSFSFAFVVGRYSIFFESVFVKIDEMWG